MSYSSSTKYFGNAIEISPSLSPVLVGGESYLDYDSLGASNNNNHQQQGKDSKTNGGSSNNNNKKGNNRRNRNRRSDDEEEEYDENMFEFDEDLALDCESKHYGDSRLKAASNCGKKNNNKKKNNNNNNITNSSSSFGGVSPPSCIGVSPPSIGSFSPSTSGTSDNGGPLSRSFKGAFKKSYGASGSQELLSVSTPLPATTIAASSLNGSESVFLKHSSSSSSSSNNNNNNNNHNNKVKKQVNDDDDNFVTDEELRAL